MSAQSEEGDFSIEPEPNTRLVDAIGHKWHRTEGCRRWHNDSVRRSECLTWVDLREHHGPLTMADGSTIPATEPEDKDDLYVEPEPLTEPSVDNSEDLTEPEDADDVEPEPLKEDDAVLLWARVVDAKPDSDGEVEVSLWRADGYQTSYATTYTLPDAIIRPDAGQVPPWVKPAVCSSLHFIESERFYIRCSHPEGHVGTHGADFSPGRQLWSDDDGRATEGGAS